MDPTSLPIDVDAVLARLHRWVACESPSWDGTAVSRMARLAAEDLLGLGAEVRTVSGVRGWGDCVLAEFDPADRRPGILVLGHMDTVHPVGSLDGPMPWRVEDDRCYGPGAYDMKGGIVLAVEALVALRRAGIGTKLPVRFLLTSDEESGSASTRGLIERSARAERCVLVPEGAEASPVLVSGRFPTARFQVWTHGKAVHALLHRDEGRSALSAMLRVLREVEGMHRDECSVTVSCMSAGQAVSTVPVEAYAEVVCTAKRPELLDEMEERLIALGPSLGVGMTVKVKARRPSWTPTEDDVRLWERARDISRGLGLELGRETLFGGSDGNLTGGAGVTTLDGLGIVGRDAHQPTEHIEISSIVPRGRLLAGLMATVE